MRAFCREPVPKSKEQLDKNMMERVKKNDPVAMCHMGRNRHHEGDYQGALKYFTNAAGLDDADAHYNLSCMYSEGIGVEKDKKRFIYHAEQAAIGGHSFARHNLECSDARNGRFERAKKHFIIAANLGYDGSLKQLMKLYKNGHASKEDYAGALRAYQAAVDATKSAERDEAEEAVKSGRISKTFVWWLN